MSSATKHPEDAANEVEDWIKNNYHPETPGIDHVGVDDESVVIYLEENLDLERFEDVIEESGYEQDEEYELEVMEVEGAPAVNVYEIRNLDNGSKGKFKVGTTYRATDKIVLSGTSRPIGPDGEPAGDVISDTLDHLLTYESAINHQ